MFMDLFYSYGYWKICHYVSLSGRITRIIPLFTHLCRIIERVDGFLCEILIQIKTNKVSKPND